MSIRGALVLLVTVGCMNGLVACTSSTQLGGQGLSQTDDTDNGPASFFSGLWSSKASGADKSSAAGDTTASGDTTGAVSVNTQPAEPGPSGEPVAPLAAPGLVGDAPDDDLQQGKRYFRANHFGLAEKSFQRAVEKHPRDAEAWVDLAASYDRLHRFDLADRAYTEAIRLIGPTPEILNDQGFSYMLRGDYARARQKLLQARAKDPANPYVQANLELLQESGMSGKGIQ
jgi:Flp pilus assembly protein TadD